MSVYARRSALPARVFRQYDRIRQLYAHHANPPPPAALPSRPAAGLLTALINGLVVILRNYTQLWGEDGWLNMPKVIADFGENEPLAALFNEHNGAIPSQYFLKWDTATFDSLGLTYALHNGVPLLKGMSSWSSVSPIPQNPVFGLYHYEETYHQLNVLMNAMRWWIKASYMSTTSYWRGTGSYTHPEDLPLGEEDPEDRFDLAIADALANATQTGNPSPGNAHTSYLEGPNKTLIDPWPYKKRISWNASFYRAFFRLQTNVDTDNWPMECLENVEYYPRRVPYPALYDESVPSPMGDEEHGVPASLSLFQRFPFTPEDAAYGLVIGQDLPYPGEWPSTEYNIGDEGDYFMCRRVTGYTLGHAGKALLSWDFETEDPQ